MVYELIFNLGLQNAEKEIMSELKKHKRHRLDSVRTEGNHLHISLCANAEEEHLVCVKQYSKDKHKSQYEILRDEEIFCHGWEVFDILELKKFWLVFLEKE